MKYETCPNCKGFKYVQLHVLKQGLLWNHYEIENQICTICGGVGKIAIATQTVQKHSFASNVAANVVAGTVATVLAPALCVIM